MIKNNIIIKYNNHQLEYDDDTAIALSFNAYNFSDISNIWLSHTNDFSLPITKKNMLAFEFAEKTESNPQSVYTSGDCSIYVDGAKVLEGSLYLESISDDRYNVIFTVSKDVFDKLDELPFSKLQGDEYPDSLCAQAAYYWNNTILPTIVSSSDDSSTVLEKIVTYCNELDSDGKTPKNNYCLPVLLNQYAYYTYSSQYANLNKGTTYIKRSDNNIHYKYEDTSTLGKDARGFIIGNYFTSGKLQYDSTIPGYFIGNGKGKDIRYGQSLISPFWMSIDTVITLLENYTGWKFKNILDIINDIYSENTNGKKLFLHLPGVEFTYDFDWQSTSITEATHNILFDGKLQMIKGKDGWYGYKTTDETDYIEDLTDDDLPYNITCLDLLKNLMQEYSLTLTIDGVKKIIYFYRTSDAKTLTADEKKLVGQSEKKFTIDNYEQNNLIKYSNIADNDEYAGSVNIVCTNKHLSDDVDHELFSIDNRYLYSNSKYEFIDTDGIYIDNAVTNLSDNEIEKYLLYALPYYSDDEDALSNINDICIGQNLRTFPYTDDESYQIPAIISTVNVKTEITRTIPFINAIEQPTIAQTKVYSYLQEIVYKPQYLKVTVLKDINFLINWKAFNVVHINGLTGKYFVQSVSEFNPRTDNTMTLELIKLPSDYTPSYYTLNLSVSPEDGGTVSGAGKYAEESVVNIKATANDGYWFKNWSDGNTNSSRAIKISNNLTLTANFSNAPQGYTRLEYIGDLNNVNGSFIDLGFVPTSNTVSFLDYEFSTTLDTPNNVFYGYYQGVDTKDYRFLIGCFNMFSGIISFTSSTISTYFRGRHTIELGNFYVKEGTTLISRGAAQTVDTTNNMCLFGDTSSSSYSSGRVYGLKTGYYESDGGFTVEHNFIPVKQDSNNAVGFYDIANDEFYPANGSIVYGPEL